MTCIYREFYPDKQVCAVTCDKATFDAAACEGGVCGTGTMCVLGDESCVCWGEDGLVPPDSPPCDIDTREGCPDGTVPVTMNNGDYKNPAMLCVCVQPCGEEGSE